MPLLVCEVNYGHTYRILSVWVVSESQCPVSYVSKGGVEEWICPHMSLTVSV